MPLIRVVPHVVALYHADCRAAIRALPDNSIDSVVTDPPYALESIRKRFGGKTAAPAQHGTDGSFARMSRGFMGQQWDTGEVAFDPDFWREVLRVMKPGGCLLSFGGTRTYHRMACAIDDAGFEIRDQFAWMYGTGQPHNHAIDVEGYEGWRTPGLKGSWEPIAVARKPISEKTVAANVRRRGTGGYHIEACRVPAPDQGRYPANIQHDGSDDVVSLFPKTKGQRSASRSDRPNKRFTVYGDMADGPSIQLRGDKGLRPGSSIPRKHPPPTVPDPAIPRSSPST